VRLTAESFFEYLESGGTESRLIEIPIDKRNQAVGLGKRHQGVAVDVAEEQFCLARGSVTESHARARDRKFGLGRKRESCHCRFLLWFAQ